MAGGQRFISLPEERRISSWLVIPMKYSLLVFLAVLLALIGCKEKAAQHSDSTQSKDVSTAPPAFRPLFPGEKAEDIIKNIIVRYNELLTFGYQNLNMNPLQEVATLNQAEKAYFHMAALGEGNVRMVSHLNKIDFDRVTFPEPHKAVIRTRETWDFSYTDIKTGEKKEEQKDFVYFMTYTIEQKDNRWLITDIAASSEERPIKKTGPRKFRGDRNSGASPHNAQK